MSDRAAGGAAPTAAPAATAVPETTAGTPVQADLRVAITPPYAENLLGWRVGGTNQGMLQPMQEHLFQRDYVTWEAKPMLTTEWEVSEDGQTWHFQLREDVPYHHGDDTSAFPTSCSASSLWSHPEGKGATDWFHELLGPQGELRSIEVDALGTTAAVEEVSDSEMIWHAEPSRTVGALLVLRRDARTR
ncbi:hypothetical protein GBAR_LOCUS2340 [Geodia barretti]|uniref:Solute-binding protein family 5 domain-containing protein n=1 Tax=Geodia barretti TaxID=519541 RepID=A0AA35QZC1_GEOBA|nr:hypothetical protein GBAR_LOCUS2340 [Geodia barretti]